MLAACLACSGPTLAFDLVFKDTNDTVFYMFKLESPDDYRTVYKGQYGGTNPGWARLMVDRQTCSATLMTSPHGMRLTNVYHLYTVNNTPTTVFRGRMTGRWYCDGSEPEEYYYAYYYSVILGGVDGCWKSPGEGP